MAPWRGFLSQTQIFLPQTQTCVCLSFSDRKDSAVCQPQRSFSPIHSYLSLRHRSFSLTDTEIFLFQTRRPSPSDTRIFLSQTPDAFLSQTKCSLGEAPLEIKWSQAPNYSLRSLRRFMIAYAFTPLTTCTCIDWQTLQV